MFLKIAASKEYVAIDVAMVNPLGSNHTDFAAARPGGAATNYEAKKVERYGAKAASLGFKLVPLVVDSFGAWGDAALRFGERAAREYGILFGVHPSRAIPVLMAKWNVAVMNAVAEILFLFSQVSGGKRDYRLFTTPPSGV